MPMAEFDPCLRALGARRTRWTEYVEAYPHYVAVSAIARCFLAIPASLAASERLFR